MSATAERGLNIASQFLALAAGLIASIALLGYPLASYVLIATSANLQGMSPVTALCLLGLTVSLIASVRNALGPSRVSALISGGLAAVVLINHAFVHSDTISPAVARSLFDVLPDRAGRMSVATGLAVLLLAISLVSQRSWRLPADVSAATSMAVATTGLIGYATNAADLYALPMFSTMALNTATALFLLSVGMLIAEPKVVNKSRPTERRGGVQIAVVILIAVLTDWLLLSATAASGFGNMVIAAVVLLSGSLPVSLMMMRDARLLVNEAEGRHRNLWRSR